jgi:predicted lipoprotein with Yx(FWY)xxD motif
MNRLFVLAAAIPAAALLLAACGGGTSYGSSSTNTPTKAGAAATTAASPTAAPPTATTPASPTGAATSGQTAAGALKVGTTSKGQVLTDSAGFTLYTFKNDTTAGKSSCNGGCATTWPPIMATTAPSAPAGVTGTFALITRDDGSKQVTYNGQPIYRYAPDMAPGDVKGDGVGNVWFAVKVSGQASASPSTAAASSASDYGY